MTHARRPVQIAALMVVVLALGAATCPPQPLERQVYNAVNATAVTVDAAMSAAGDLHRAGKITDPQKAQILAVYVRYQAAARVAVAGAKTYQSRADVDAVLAQLAGVVSEIVNLIATFKGGATP